MGQKITYDVVWKGDGWYVRWRDFYNLMILLGRGDNVIEMDKRLQAAQDQLLAEVKKKEEENGKR